jgi:hypothetical protein
MEAQYSKAKEELLLDLKSKTTTVTVKEFSPTGVRFEVNYIGDVTGKYNARRTETVNVIMKPDGTIDYETRKVDFTSDGDVVLINGKGSGRMESPTKLGWEGEDSFKTASKKLAWLNSTKARTVGTQDIITQEALVKFYRKS